MTKLLEILENKEDVIKYLLDLVLKGGDIYQGLSSINNPDISEEGKLKKVIEVVAKQSLHIQQLATVLLIYAQSNNFDGDLATMLNKLGKGEEALKIMLDNKLKGK